MFKGLTSIILVGWLLMVTGDRECSWSRTTVKKVDSCPVNKSTYEQRRKDKNCQALAELQHCTTPSKFSYHCLINEYSDALIEVCAPTFVINGYCAEYNILGARIQPHYNLKCSDINPPCGDRYNSTDAYLYTGCYEIVKKNQVKTIVNTNSVFTTESSSTVGEMPVKENSSLETQPALIAVIVIVVIVVVAVVIAVLLLVIRKRAYSCQFASEGNAPENPENVLLTAPLNPEPTDRLTNGKCARNRYEAFITRGRELRNTTLEEDDILQDKMDTNKDETMDYLKAYERLNNHFVETRLTKECTSKLSQFGVVVIIGEQGSGKTSTAVHIMNSHPYDQWLRRKITSWSDLLVFKFHENTLIYIDNAFDGFIYHQELNKWWQSLCYFYFECLKPSTNVRLMISAKPNMIEKACEFVNADIKFIRKECFVHTKSFPLSREEKIKIIKEQTKLANPLQNTGTLSVAIELMDEIDKIEKQNDWPIGFPFCAHLYAFERDSFLRTISIFENPRSYVRGMIKFKVFEDKTNVIKEENITIGKGERKNDSKKDEKTEGNKEDKTNSNKEDDKTSDTEEEDKNDGDKDGDKTMGNKALFLILIFHFSPEKTGHAKENLDLKYEDDCTVLKENCPKDLLKKIPLSFKNLNERAQEMEGDVLIKNHHMYEFKHQVYLEEVRNYFFRTHFDAVVDHFPLSILRTYDETNLTEHEIDRLAKRLKHEIDQGAISEALSCKIFERSRFSERFCRCLEEDKPLMTKLLSFPDKSSGFKFPLIFWASKYNISKVSHVILDFAEKNEKSELSQIYQIHLALLGECSAQDESYVSKTEQFDFPLKMEVIQSLVLSFGNPGRTILDMMISAKKDSAFQSLENILTKATKEHILSRGESLLHYITNQSVADNSDSWNCCYFIRN